MELSRKVRQCSSLPEVVVGLGITSSDSVPVKCLKRKRLLGRLIRCV